MVVDVQNPVFTWTYTDIADPSFREAGHEILIARNGQPVAKIVKFEKQTGRIGTASRKHRSLDLDEFNAMNEEIAKEFYGEL